MFPFVIDEDASYWLDTEVGEGNEQGVVTANGLPAAPGDLMLGLEVLTKQEGWGLGGSEFLTRVIGNHLE